MLANLIIGLVMIAVTVPIHTFGLIVVSRVVAWSSTRLGLFRRHSRAVVMIPVVMGLLAVITVEIWLWAACFMVLAVAPDFETALYLSTITFSTVGYGDVVPDPAWRLLASMEGIAGFLIIGWSTAFLVTAGIRVGPFRQGEHF